MKVEYREILEYREGVETMLRDEGEIELLGKVVAESVDPLTSEDVEAIDACLGRHIIGEVEELIAFYEKQGQMEQADGARKVLALMKKP